jgi:uncharacterized protein (UPF0332 family)/predicted nucleotidyltransferase
VNERNRRLNAADEMERARRMVASAGLVAEHGHHEDAVSSAYYAAHHAARALLFSIGLEVRSHEGLRGLLGEHFERPGRVPRGTTKRLKDAFEARMTATYGLRVRFTRAQADAWVTWAAGFVETAAGILEAAWPAEATGGSGETRERGTRYRGTRKPAGAQRIPPRLLDRLADAAARACATQPDVTLAWLHGSALAGGPARDIDLAVLVRPGGIPPSDAAEAVRRRLEPLRRPAGVPRVPVPWDVRPLEHAGTPFVHRVIAEGRCVFERRAGERVAFEARVMSLFIEYRPVWEAGLRRLWEGPSRG